MATHMVSLYLEPPKGEAETAVDKWVQNHTEWTGGDRYHTLVERTVGETTFVEGHYRFEQDSTQTTLLDDLESRLQSLQGGLWYRIGYHECPRGPGEGGGACSWSDADTRENGTVPSDVPTFA